MTALTGASLHPWSTAATEPERLAAVAAGVHDPLWLLARQFQTGGLLAEDGGTPVTVTMSHLQAPLSVAGRPAAGQVEPLVEAEPAPAGDLVDTATRVRLASELFRLAADAGVGDADLSLARAALATSYPLGARGETGALAAFDGRLPDAVALYAAWLAAVGPDGGHGSLPAEPGVDPSLRAALDAPARAWVRWMTGRVGTPGGGVTPQAWSELLLGYAFTGTAALGGQPVELSAPGYDGDGLDWHCFDRASLPATPSPGPVTVVRPARVSYQGMPEPGYWTIEDGDVDLDMLAGIDPARELLVAFAHSYAGDWFLVPLPVAPGVVLVTGLTVVDTFGTTTEVLPSARLDGAGSRFRLWEVQAPSSAAADGGVGLRVLLPSAPPPLEGPPLEDVVLARDELANLGWLIELTTTDEDGERVDRYRRWLVARPSVDGGGAPAPVPDGSLVYRLGTTLPDHWYPLEAAEAGPDGHRRLRLAALPDGACEVSDEGVRGRTVSHQPGTAVDEDIVSAVGTRVRRVDRLTYTPNGYVVWRARRRETGAGEATSGLRFDVIEPPD
ncbi:MAG TPA: hypothetical protein VFJ97_00985 [Dermatophilaceae bacterium]|nr:hypothetical protein [Dermatophilaceae bacterium]